MKKTFKGKKIEVKDYRITRWNSDEFSYGSYTSFHVNSSFKDCIELRKNINNTLWMIGEHCFAEHIGTAGGAYQTGIWAAE